MIPGRHLLAPLLAVLLACAGPAALAEERRVALVVGNSAYARSPLANPRNDATAVAAALRGLGFEVLEGLDLDRRGADEILKVFGRRLEGADVGMFYYAGHGLQVNGTNYLVPVDSPMRDVHDLDDTLSLDRVQAKLEQEQRVNLLFIDACRDNPFAEELKAAARSLSRGTVGSGLATARGGAAGTFIAFATAPDKTADDGMGRHSPFTTAFLQHLPTPGLEVNNFMTEVRNDVRNATGGRQTPWAHSSLLGQFFFKPEPGTGGTEPEDVAWDRVRTRNEAELVQAFLRLYPQSRHFQQAQSRLRELSGAAVPEGSDMPKAPDPLDRTAQGMLARMPPVTRLISGGFTYRDTRMPTACGRSLAESVGQALGGTVAIASRGDTEVRGDAGGAPGEARRRNVEGRLGLPSTDTAWLLEGRYVPAGESVELTFQLVGRRGTYDSPPVAVALERDSACLREEPPARSPLTSDLNRGDLALELASPYGSNPVYTVREPPERVELQLRVNKPAHLYCFNRDEQGRIQKLLPNEDWVETRVEAGEVIFLPTDLKQRWLAKTPEVGIVKCFASDRPLSLPGTLGDVDARPEPLRGVDDEALLRAVRAADRRASLSEASVVYAVLPE